MKSYCGFMHLIIHKPRSTIPAKIVFNERLARCKLYDKNAYMSDPDTDVEGGVYAVLWAACVLWNILT